MKNVTAALFSFLFLISSANAQTEATVTPDEINASEFTGALPEGRSAVTVKLQVLLDRVGANPGVIDGVAGENVAKAIRSYEEMQGKTPTGVLTADMWSALQTPEPITKQYTIAASDVEKLVEAIPDDYAEKAKMEWLGYTSGLEAIGEKFHMDKDFLAYLNPGSSFNAGDTITVVDPGVQREIVVTRIVADKAAKRLVIYGQDGKPDIVYPATIGSESNPSPTGTHEVRAIASNPNYTYNPNVNFQQGDNTGVLTIPPGPNGPVGSTWIDLTEPTYGIHGTPDPANISKTESHGCVRLTNWDAAELSKLVKPGVQVYFEEVMTSLY